MIRIALLGALGRMGRVLTHEIFSDDALSLAVRVDISASDSDEIEPAVISDLSEAAAFDVLIDFSHPKATSAALSEMKKRRKPWIVATTGIDAELHEALVELSHEQPIFLTANTSIGVALMRRLCSEAAAALESWDCEIVEMHHRNKLDAPSGTALAIAKSIQDALASKPEIVTSRSERRCIRPLREIGISSVRGGSVVGVHEAKWFGPHERFEIRHEAEDRSIFAIGAILAAKWLVSQPNGLYDMDDILSDILK